MRQPVIAVYPGTFDPITLGHLDLMQRACVLFDEVVVGVAMAHHKKTLFNLEERLEMVREATAPLSRVRVAPFEGLVRDFVRAQRGVVMVRGVRSVSDFDYEQQLAGMNRHLMPEVETIFMAPSAKLQHTSSTLVREISMLGGEVEPWVTPEVLRRLTAKKHALA
ncbi:MAG: pantetheine-phosphate adenylyltransferase [Betaproteobacteria bacterium]|nr:pantetheine-phosphate adenylyltransferase [Betaproteobacteria bacterium]NBY06216.1 pantetheine-phosphate adenylyltransferase [Betaproteobacteria bacterium]